MAVTGRNHLPSTIVKVFCVSGTALCSRSNLNHRLGILEPQTVGVPPERLPTQVAYMIRCYAYSCVLDTVIVLAATTKVHVSVMIISLRGSSSTSSQPGHASMQYLAISRACQRTFTVVDHSHRRNAVHISTIHHYCTITHPDRNRSYPQ